VKGSTSTGRMTMWSFFFIDTNPFIEEYFNRSWAHSVDGGLSSQSIEVQKTFLSNALKASNATWKIAIGHHPFYSNGYRGGSSELVSELGHMFEEYEMNLYLNGHDHDLQHVHPPGKLTHFFTSGAGSKTNRGFGTKETLFEYDNSGFASVSVATDSINVSFHDGDGKVLYTYRI